jgi:CspA family cold shock protein
LVLIVVDAGKVVRFDPVKGYGFISPDSGDEDVFLHVNDVLDDKQLIRPGVVMEFQVEDGDRGLKASRARIVHGVWRSGSEPVHSDAASGENALSDGTCEVLTNEAYRREVTEALLISDPPLTGPQILRVREAMLGIGRKYGWIED